MKPYKFNGAIAASSSLMILDRYNISNINNTNKLRFETYDLKPIKEIINNLYDVMYTNSELPTFDKVNLFDYYVGNFGNINHKVVAQHTSWCTFESWYTKYIKHLQLLSEGKYDLSFLLTDKGKRVALECYIFNE